MSKTNTNPLGITIKNCTATNENPNMDDSENMDHWKVTLLNPKNKRQLTVIFSQGYGHNGQEPTADDVISCLVFDSDCLDYDFEEWASNLGYNPDSRKAYRTFDICLIQSRKLIKFIDSEEDMEALREWASNY